MKITKRADNELSQALQSWSWRFHHIGIPTTAIKPGEKYLPKLKFFTSGFEQNPFGIEWMQFEKDCQLNELIITLPHVAFEMNDLDKKLKEHQFNILTQPDAPSDSMRVAMIEHHEAPVELIAFSK